MANRIIPVTTVSGDGTGISEATVISIVNGILASPLNLDKITFNQTENSPSITINVDNNSWESIQLQTSGSSYVRMKPSNIIIETIPNGYITYISSSYVDIYSSNAYMAIWDDTYWTEVGLDYIFMYASTGNYKRFEVHEQFSAINSQYLMMFETTGLTNPGGEFGFINFNFNIDDGAGIHVMNVNNLFSTNPANYAYGYTCTYLSNYSVGFYGYLSLSTSPIGVLIEGESPTGIGLKISSTAGYGVKSLPNSIFGSDSTNPLSSLETAKTFGHKVTKITDVDSPYTLGDTTVLLIDSTGAVTINLPDCATVTNRRYEIKLIGTGSSIIDPYLTQTIDGELTFELSIQYNSISITTEGLNWFVI